MRTARLLAAIAAKDLRVELRSRELLGTMFVFALLALVAFQFAFRFVPPPPHSTEGVRLPPGTAAFRDLGAGVLWTVFSLAGLMGLARSFALERENGCLEGLLLSPVDRWTLFLGKLSANLVILLALEAFVLALCAVLFGMPLLPVAGSLVPILVVNSLAFAVPGTLFSLLCSRARGGDALLAVLQLPLQFPVMAYAVGATGSALRGARLGEVREEIGVSAGAALAYLGIALLVFERAAED